MHYLYLGIFIIPLIVNPFALNIYSSGKLAWFLLFLGGALLHLFWKSEITIRYHRGLLIYISVWLLSLLGSTIFSAAPIQSLFGDYEVSKGFLLYLLLAGHFIACWQLFSDAGFKKLFWKSIKALGLVLSLHGIVQLFNPENAQYLFRAYATVGQPNFLGQLLIFPIFITLGDFFADKKNGKAKLANGALLALMLAALFFTVNRATWLALLASLYLWFLAYCPIGKNKKIGITLAALAIAIIAYLGLNLDIRSLHSRGFLWEALPTILGVKHLFFGSGLANFYREFAAVMPPDVFYYEQFYAIPTSPHNEIVEALIERGFVGALLYVLPLIYLLRELIMKKLMHIETRAAGFALLAYYISVQFSFSVIEHFVFLGAFWAIFLHGTVKFKSFTLKTIGAAWSLPIFLLAMSLFYASYSVFSADTLLARAMNEYGRRSDVSFELMEKATRAVPVYADPRRLIVNLFSEMPHLIAEHVTAYSNITGDDFRAKIMRIEQSAQNIEQSANDKAWDEVAKLIEETRKLAPNVPLLYTIAGNSYFKAGKCEEAVDYYRKLDDLAPDYPKDSEELRIWRKTATQYGFAMKNLAECKTQGF